MATSSRSHRITRGDAEAVLGAFGAGGWAVLLHSRTAQGAPADFFGSHGSIRPFAGSPWDGAHFCAEDWHVIVMADIEGGDGSFQHHDAERIMNGLDVSFTLDGTPLPATRTAVKHFLNPEYLGLQAAYYFQQGQVMSPADLSIGSRRLEVTMTDASGQQSFQDGITFVIDAPGVTIGGSWRNWIASWRMGFRWPCRCGGVPQLCAGSIAWASEVARASSSALRLE